MLRNTWRAGKIVIEYLVNIMRSKNIAKIVLILASVFFLCGFSFKDSFKDLAAPVYENIRQQALANFKELFHREVKIGGAGGRVLGQIILKDVIISPDLKAEVIKINFNPIKYMQNHGDIVPAITSLEIERGFAKVVRDKNNQINLAALFVDPNAKNNTPPNFPFKSKIIIKKAQIEYLDQAGIYPGRSSRTYSFEFDLQSGSLDLSRPPKIKFNLKASQNGAVISANGETDLSTQKYRISLKAKNLDPKIWGPFAIPLDLAYQSGQVDLGLDLAPDRLKIDAAGIINNSQVKVSGSVKNFNRPVCTVSADVRNWKLYNYPVSGQVLISYQDNLLELKDSKIGLFKGEAKALGKINFAKPVPEIDLKIFSKNMSLSALGNGLPGIIGNASAQVNVSGNFEEFSGSLEAQAERAFVLGQPISNAEAVFAYERGDILLKSLSITSKNSHFKSSGQIKKNMETTLQADAKGIWLSGENFIGRMEALIETFNGSLAFKLDHGFMSSPLRNITASGSIEVSRARIAEQIIDAGAGEISLSKGKIDIPFFKIRSGGSELVLAGSAGVNTPTSLKISSRNLNLLDAKILNLVLPSPAQNPEGICDINLKVDGMIQSEKKLASLEPLLGLNYKGSINLKNGRISGVSIKTASADFEFLDRRLKISNAQADTELGKVTVGLTLSDHQLRFSSPLLIEGDYDKYELSGKADLDSEKLDLDFKIHRAALDSLILISLKISKMIGTSIVSGNPSRPMVNFKPTAIPPKFNPLFTTRGSYYLKVWENAQADIESLKKKGIPEFWKDFAGNLSANFKIAGPLKKPQITFSSKFSNFAYKDYPFDSVEISGNYSNNRINFGRTALKKGGGELRLNGILDLKESKNNLNLIAQNMPLDSLEPFLGKKGFSGGFDVAASVGGSFQDPTGQVQVEAKNISIAGINYRKISGEASLSGGSVNLSHLTVNTKNDVSRCSGTYSLKNETFDLSAVLSGEGIGLINLFNEEARFMGGEAGGKVSLKKTAGRLTVAGSLQLKNAEFDLKKINSKLTSANLELYAQNNILTISSLNGYWIGKSTKYKPNFIAAAGKIDLGSQTVSLAVLDTDLTLDFENIYSGKIKVENLTLTGPIGRPELKGKLGFSDGVLFLTNAVGPAKPASTPPSTLNFNLLMEFNKNMYLTAGSVSSLDLSNIFLSLEFSGKDLLLQGDIKQPKLAGQIDFKRGTVNVLNREFELLNETEQKKYYPYDYDKITPNYARFASEYGALPHLNLTADVAVEAEENAKKTRVFVVTHLNGVPDAANSKQGLNTSFDAYREDQSTSPPEMIKAPYSDTDIKLLLLPSFVKSLVGLSKENVKSTDVLADYLDLRLQVLVFRDIERKLESALGLESLTLQYNFGKDIRRNLGKTDPYTGVQPLYGIGFIKGFFDRLFIQLKYSQFEDESLANRWTAFNYEITYRLSPTMSVAYFKEPLTATGIQTDNYKVTLKNSVQF